MPEHTMADLLAGVIDLARPGTPPHGPGPCTDQCVPACTAGPVADRPDAAPGPDAAVSLHRLNST